MADLGEVEGVVIGNWCYVRKTVRRPGWKLSPQQRKQTSLPAAEFVAFLETHDPPLALKCSTSDRTYVFVVYADPSAVKLERRAQAAHELTAGFG